MNSQEIAVSRGDQIGALKAIQGPRYRRLQRRLQFSLGKQHDQKRFDFDGRIIPEGGVEIESQQPMLTGEKIMTYVPLRARRPSTPYRLGKIIVRAFTNLLFSEGRFPTLSVGGDVLTDDFARALAKKVGLRTKMIRARNLAGGCGAAGFSWCYVNGIPRVRVHDVKNVLVHSWEDKEELRPRHVSEVYLYPVEEYDPAKKKLVEQLYWYRQDWTMNEDIAFFPIRYERGREPEWRAPDVTKSVTHNDGLNHFVWAQNVPGDDPDSEPDYADQYDALDDIDVLLSVLMRGAKLNLDPTLVLQVDKAMWERQLIKKGSENALVLDALSQEDAKYLELAGTSIEAGIKLFHELRTTILEASQCVVPDPNEIAASGMSSVAMKVIYAPMLSQGDVLRDQWEQPITRIIDGMCAAARKHSSVVMYTAKGEPVEVRKVVALPPKIVEVPADTPGSLPKVLRVPRIVGPGGPLDLEWGPWFSPTPDDRSKEVTTLVTASGNQPILSTETASEEAAKLYGRDPKEEASRVKGQVKEQMAQQGAAFGGADGSPGGKVEHTHQLPGGSTVKTSKAGPPHPGSSSSSSSSSSSESADEPKAI